MAIEITGTGNHMNFIWYALPVCLVLIFVLYDCCYYRNHPLGHVMNVLWAAHEVQHSSEEYNLRTVLRQCGGSIFSWVFYSPL